MCDRVSLNARRVAQVSRAVALYEFKGEHEHDLSFKVSDR
jgi:hypothetical protein